MINKEHYQFIRQHSAFENLPVESFDKLAIEIQFHKVPKGQIIVETVFFFFMMVMHELSNMMLQIPFLTQTISKRAMFFLMVVCFLMSVTITQLVL